MVEQYPPDPYTQQLEAKISRLTQLIQPYSPPPLAVFSSPDKHYRMRAEFRVWHEGDELYYIMFEPQSKTRISLEQFPVASQLINQAMPLVLAYVKTQPVLKQRLFQIDYLSTLSHKLLITLIYHKKLDEQWQNAALALRQFLQQHGLDTQLVGRASGQKICLDVDYVDEVLRVKQRTLLYRQVENSFTQPNAIVNQQMLSWAHDVTLQSQDDLLEFYCGNGNFSLALADNFRKVLATEVSKASVNAAQYNINANNIDNVTIVRLSAEELTQALQGVRTFRRLQGITLQDYHCQTVLVDPPRSGLSTEALAIIKHYPKIIYISCNPNTLQHNLHTLCQTHRITHFALFDQFPFTEHIECGVVLEKW